ncbi:hypothetical protein BCR44DRAFT_1430149 [Catenaria anguillulae PL171]|uniref:AAA+ ATPase domain-containing protein n=1 Tax=Catenaria anguillulae PL171 TaxID=765915 RepID=A0A1Y2HTG8_9FUNG|nr:hypothetical protein BCR44DRAFT_1430149 [Catenaria anguillulae PL171]
MHAIQYRHSEYSNRLDCRNSTSTSAMAPTADYLDSFASGHLLKAIVAAFPLPKTIMERAVLEDALAPLPFFQAAAGTVTRLTKLVPSVLMSMSDRNSPSVQLCRVPTNDEPLARLPEVLALDVYIYLTERTATTKSGSVYLDPLQKFFASHPAFVSGSVQGTLHDVLPRFSLFFTVYERKGRAAVKLNAVGSGKPMSEWSTIMFNSPHQLASRALNFALKYPLPTPSSAARPADTAAVDTSADNSGLDDVWDDSPAKPPAPATTSHFSPAGHDGASSLFDTPTADAPPPTFYSSSPLDNVFGSPSLNFNKNNNGDMPHRPSTPTHNVATVDPFNTGIPSLISSTRCNVYLVQSASKAIYFANHLISLPRTHLAVGGLGDLTRRPSVVALDAVTLAYPALPTKSLVVIWDFGRSPPDDIEPMTHELRRVLQYAPTLVVHAGARLAEALEFQLGFPMPADSVYDVAELYTEWSRVSREAQGVLAMVDVLGHVGERIKMTKAQMVRLIAPMVGKKSDVGQYAASVDLNLALHACQLPTNGARSKVAAWATQAEERARKMDLDQVVSKRYWDLHSDTIALARAAAHDVDQLISAFTAMEARITELITWLRRARSFLAVSQLRLGDGWSPNPALPKHVPVQAKFDAQSKIVWRYPTSTTTASNSAVDGTDEGDGDKSSDPAVGLGGISQQLQRVHDQFMDKTQKEVADLMSLLPERVREAIQAIPDATETLNEVILDLGEPPRLRFFAQGKTAIDLDHVGIVTEKDLDSIVNGRTFSSDRRGGINGQLHRISWIPNRNGEAVGLTIRVGRACPPGEGVGQMLQDLVEEGESVLLLGKPGSGKTHTLRDLVARLSDKGNNVMIVDTSNEARRMQVRDRARQFEVLLEAVQNHTPDFVAIDEISDAKEVAAARSVVTRVQGMVATAHGDLESILRNKVMRDLVGGLQTATVGDARAKELGGRKTVTTRAEESLFSTVVELVSRTEVRVFKNVNRVVDDILHPHKYPWAERRWLEADIPRAAAAATVAHEPTEVADDYEDPAFEHEEGASDVENGVGDDHVSESQEEKAGASAHRAYFWVRVEPFDEIQLELAAVV